MENTIIQMSQYNLKCIQIYSKFNLFKNLFHSITLGKIKSIYSKFIFNVNKIQIL